MLIFKKIDWVSPGFDRVPGRPPGSTGFHWANSQADFYLHPDQSQARAGPGFKTLTKSLKQKQNLTY